MRDKCSSFLQRPRVTAVWARASLGTAALVKTKVRKLGSEVARLTETVRTGLLASKSCERRLRTGRLARAWIWLSVRSIESSWSLVTARFSMAGILCPRRSISRSRRGERYDGVRASRSASRLLRRESGG